MFIIEDARRRDSRRSWGWDKKLWARGKVGPSMTFTRNRHVHTSCRNISLHDTPLNIRGIQPDINGGLEETVKMKKMSHEKKTWYAYRHWLFGLGVILPIDLQQSVQEGGSLKGIMPYENHSYETPAPRLFVASLSQCTVTWQAWAWKVLASLPEFGLRMGYNNPRAQQTFEG